MLYHIKRRRRAGGVLATRYSGFAVCFCRATTGSTCAQCVRRPQSAVCGTVSSGCAPTTHKTSLHVHVQATAGGDFLLWLYSPRGGATMRCVVRAQCGVRECDCESAATVCTVLEYNGRPAPRALTSVCFCGSGDVGIGC